MSKVIFVLADACGYDAATENMGYLEQLKEQGLCAKYRVLGQLPSMSRPMYQTLMTGLPSNIHGTVTNAYRGEGYPENLFQMCSDAGLSTAAAAYHWFSELYNKNGPFQLFTQRYQLDGKGAIQYGIFYSRDSYPDSHIYADAEFLRCEYNPDFLLIHPMGIDDSGHREGSESDAYKSAVMNNSELISEMLPKWQQAGYDVVITADHGMDKMGMHGGNTHMQREVPLYILSQQLKMGDFTNNTISHLSIAPLICKLLGIEKGNKMQEIEVEIEGLI